MASPVIDSITPTFPAGQTYLTPGQSATITVVAHDPDAKTITVNVDVVDSTGAHGTGKVTIPVQDVLTINLTADGGTVTRVSPNSFTLAV